jgi:hypothetical protein
VGNAGKSVEIGGGEVFYPYQNGSWIKIRGLAEGCSTSYLFPAKDFRRERSAGLTGIVIQKTRSRGVLDKKSTCKWQIKISRKGAETQRISKMLDAESRAG